MEFRDEMLKNLYDVINDKRARKWAKDDRSIPISQLFIDRLLEKHH